MLVRKASTAFASLHGSSMAVTLTESKIHYVKGSNRCESKRFRLRIELYASLVSNFGSSLVP